MKRVPNALVVLCAAGVLTACSHADHHHAAEDVVLIQRGSRVTNAYALAYQTCATTPRNGSSRTSWRRRSNRRRWRVRSRGPRSLRRCVPQPPEGVSTLSRAERRIRRTSHS